MVKSVKKQEGGVGQLARDTSSMSFLDSVCLSQIYEPHADLLKFAPQSLGFAYGLLCVLYPNSNMWGMVPN